MPEPPDAGWIALSAAADDDPGIPLDAAVLVHGEDGAVARRLVALLGRGHEGPLIAIARYGVLALPERSPGPASVGRAAPPAFVDAGRLSPRGLLRMVRQATRRGLDWRPWVDAIAVHRAALWSRWSPAERWRFRRHLEALWRLHLDRWPQVLLDPLQDAIDARQVEVVAGRLRVVEDVRTGDAVAQLAGPGPRRRWRIERLVASPLDPPE